MKSFEMDRQTFMNHLLIDMRHDRFNIWLALNESDGRMPDADLYENLFEEFIKKEIIPEIGCCISCGFDVLKRTIDMDDEGWRGIRNRFVRRIVIRFEIKYDRKNWHMSHIDNDNTHFDSRTPSSLSDFASGYYGITSEHYSEPCVFMTLRCVCQNNSQLKRYLSMDFAHELMHAYDEYMRWLNRAKAFKDTAMYRRYRDVVQTGDYSQIEYDARNFIYETTPPEQNAVNAQLKTEMKGLVDEHPDPASEHVGYIWSIIRKTEVWKKMEHAMKVEEDIMTSSDDVLDAYMDAFGKLLGRKFSAGGDFVRYVRRKAEPFRNHVMRHAASLANDYLKQFSVPPFEGFINFGNDYLIDMEDVSHFGRKRLK